MNQLYLGDCLEVMDKLISQRIKVDAIITDPPYGTTACKWDSIIPFDAMWERLNKLIKSNGAIILFGSEPFNSLLRVSNLKSYKYDWVWDKKSAGNVLIAKYQPLKNHELISIFSNGRITYYPQYTFGHKDRTNEKPISQKSELNSKIKSGTYQASKTNKPLDAKYPKSILEFSKQGSECSNSKAIHPTQKPVALIEYLIKTYTQENELILDFTIGSGTTAIAALNTNRQFIGIEKDEGYYNLALERIKNHERDKSF